MRSESAPTVASTTPAGQPSQTVATTPTTPRRPRRPVAANVRITLLASRGDCWVSAHEGSSSSGRVVLERLLAQGETVTLHGRKIWLSPRGRGERRPFGRRPPAGHPHRNDERRPRLRPYPGSPWLRCRPGRYYVRRSALLVLMGAAGFLAAVVLTAPATGNLVPTLPSVSITLPTLPPPPPPPTLPPPPPPPLPTSASASAAASARRRLRHLRRYRHRRLPHRRPRRRCLRPAALRPRALPAQRSRPSPCLQSAERAPHPRRAREAVCARAARVSPRAARRPGAEPRSDFV